AVAGPSPRRRHGEGTAPDARFREPKLAELAISACYRLAVDAEAAREVADGRQARARRHAPGLDAAPQVVDELAMDRRRAGPALQRDDHAPTVIRSIALVKCVNNRLNMWLIGLGQQPALRAGRP